MGKRLPEDRWPSLLPSTQLSLPQQPPACALTLPFLAPSPGILPGWGGMYPCAGTRPVPSLVRGLWWSSRVRPGKLVMAL